LVLKSHNIFISSVQSESSPKIHLIFFFALASASLLVAILFILEWSSNHSSAASVDNITAQIPSPINNSQPRSQLETGASNLKELEGTSEDF
jgi:hypothetical protein